MRELRRDIQLIRFILPERWIIGAGSMALNSQYRPVAADDGDPGLPRNSRRELRHRVRELPVGITRNSHGEIPVDDQLSFRW